MDNPAADQTEHAPQQRPWSRYGKRAAVILCAAGAALIVAVVVYGVVLFVFEPEDAPGASRVAAFKCLSRAERVYIRQLRGIADERRQHLDSVVEFMEQRGADPRVSQDPQWRWDLSTSHGRVHVQLAGHGPDQRPAFRPPHPAQPERHVRIGHQFRQAFPARRPHQRPRRHRRCQDRPPGFTTRHAPNAGAGRGTLRPRRAGRTASARIRSVARAPVTRVIWRRSTPPPASLPCSSAATAAGARRR